MPILLKLVISLFAFSITSSLLADQPGRHYLAFAAGCFYFVHPIPMTFGLAGLIFWDRLHSRDGAKHFQVLPALAGAAVAGLLLAAPRLFDLATATAPAAEAVTQYIGWSESLRNCLATPLVEEYLCRLIVFAGLVKAGWSNRYALIASALFFACMQGQPNTWLVQAAAGCVYGALYLRHGFWGAVTAHSLGNVSALLASVWL